MAYIKHGRDFSAYYFTVIYAMSCTTSLLVLVLFKIPIYSIIDLFANLAIHNTYIYIKHSYLATLALQYNMQALFLHAII